MTKKTYKTFKEFAKDYLKEYDDANFAGIGGFSIGSMDSMKPDADLGDTAPRNQGTGDSRGTMAVMPSKNIQHKLNRKNHIKKDEKGKAMTGSTLSKIDMSPTVDDTQDIKDTTEQTIQNLQFVNEKAAKDSIDKIEISKQSIVHKVQAATSMAERAKVASERAVNEETKNNLVAAHNVYKTFIDKLKKESNK
jgi:hypothetical protein